MRRWKACKAPFWFFSSSFLIRSVQHYHEEVKGFITDNKTRRERERELRATGRRLVLHKIMCAYINSSGHTIMIYIHDSLLVLNSRVSTL